MGTIIPKSTFTQILTINQPHSHTVVLTNDYLIGETAVTQDLWRSVMLNYPSRFIEDKHPVDSVSWNYCQTFISRLDEETLSVILWYAFNTPLLIP